MAATCFATVTMAAEFVESPGYCRFGDVFTQQPVQPRSVTFEQRAAAFPLGEAAKIVNLAEVVQPKLDHHGQPFTVQFPGCAAHGGTPFSQRNAHGIHGVRHGLADLDRDGGRSGLHLGGSGCRRQQG
jgi:hypothetical protein